MCFVEVIDTAGQGRVGFLDRIFIDISFPFVEEYVTLRDQWVR